MLLHCPVVPWRYTAYPLKCTREMRTVLIAKFSRNILQLDMLLAQQSACCFDARLHKPSKIAQATVGEFYERLQRVQKTGDYAEFAAPERSRAESDR